MAHGKRATARLMTAIRKEGDNDVGPSRDGNRGKRDRGYERWKIIVGKGGKGTVILRGYPYYVLSSSFAQGTSLGRGTDKVVIDFWGGDSG